ncbi:Nucleoside triphosphate pyrophosphohydrolase MazG [Euzebya pacifica]|uniref:Nucleoside triphosphate pyrophosphohydrolase MazG n=1 Tax=Euzebya pacifica TaxID=1608957 RepID=A0A346Y2C7_9ACTN|nr:nucleoside triphosphate pyrophosphohydrolase [Euzebya pacifica]AXV08624.1 Nucleoside triphosphate pyrophosphohydrolase MazG [Euzebya pacifica]
MDDTTAAPMPRLVLVDTVDQLPGLLPLHAFQALRSCDLIVLSGPDHPLASHLDMAEERYETVPTDVGERAMGRAEMLGGLSLVDKARATWVLDRAKAVGSVGYVLGPDDTDAFTSSLGMEAAREAVEVEVVYFGLAPKGIKVLDLVKVQERLLAPDGCPWDAEQTHGSLAPYAIEEAHELAEAIAEGDPTGIAEELGDVLMQVTFHAELSEAFDIDAVAQGITDKLVRRHPHVFADVVADDAETVVANWEDIKAEEKPERTGPFDGVPSGLPAVASAAKVQSRAERLGFAWPDVNAAAEQVAEELEEVLDAEDDTRRAEEIGDLLFAVVSMARAAGTDPEQALRGAVGRFRSRFERTVDTLATEGVDPAGLTEDDWRERWTAARDAE